MVLEAIWQLIEARVFGVPGNDLLFNPYNQVDPKLDVPGADAIRRANLRGYLSSFPAPPAVFVVGEAPGPHGCRFSGVPFTSEAKLVSGVLPFGGKQSSNRPAPHEEYSARAVWQELLPCFPRFLMWNCVPLHPHRAGEPLSIRNPSGREVREWAPVLGDMVGVLRPSLVVALGRKAEEGLRLAGVEAVYLRHPSQGGLPAFREGVRRLRF